MAGKKEKERFLFFKYVPPKKSQTPIKNYEYKKIESGSELDTEWFNPPECPDAPYEPPCPAEPGYGECPEVPYEPPCPAEPGYGECPDVPEMPEYPDVPEYPKVPECPEVPELPEIPECPEEEEPVEEGPCPENAIMHVIQAGDTFWKLARRYGTSVEAIAAANPEQDPLNLQIGVTICIPMGIPGAKG